MEGRRPPLFSLGWGAVDRAADPRRVSRALERSGMPAWQALRRQTYAALRAQPGQRILDIGCGSGNDVRALARLVGARGLVVGVDSSAALIDEARTRSVGLALPLAFQVGQAEHLGFADDVFDACHTSNVLLHVQDVALALKEVLRVLRPGGKLIACEPDLDTFILDLPDRELTRRILRFRCDLAGNGWIGRQLYQRLRHAGWTDVAVVPHTVVETDFVQFSQWSPMWDSTLESAVQAGVLTASEAQEWWARLETAGRAGRFFLAVTHFIVTGHKPAS